MTLPAVGVAFFLLTAALVAGVVAADAALAGAVGVGLYRRAGGRWERKVLAEGD